MGVFQWMVERIDQGRTFVSALVLMADGSTPTEAGTRAVIDESGEIQGTIGGGQVEAEAQRRAVEVCRLGEPVVLDIDLKGASAESESPICGGAMRVLLDPTAAAQRAAYERAAGALRQRNRGVLVTRIRRGRGTEVEAKWFPERGVPSGAGFPGPEEIRSSMGAETASLFSDDTVEECERLTALVEPVVPNPLLLIAGGGHIGQALARQAVLIGFDVTVLDDRPEFTDEVLFPGGVRTRCGPVGEELGACEMDDETYVVIVTRGHRSDAEALAACVGGPAAYVGMIGSGRKVAMMRQNLLESGLATEEELDRVFAPIGLDIGAETVPEIATSIAAELIAVRRRGPDAPPPGHMVER